jgi:hypothetical protein
MRTVQWSAGGCRVLFGRPLTRRHNRGARRPREPGLAFSFRGNAASVVGLDGRQAGMSAGVLAAAWLCRRAARDGWHLVHGSCLVVDGGGVLCLGGKASGKSTLAMLAAQVLGASVVANDRVLVRAAAGVVEAMAVPRASAWSGAGLARGSRGGGARRPAGTPERARAAPARSCPWPDRAPR